MYEISNFDRFCSQAVEICKQCLQTVSACPPDSLPGCAPGIHWGTDPPELQAPKWKFLAAATVCRQHNFLQSVVMRALFMRLCIKLVWLSSTTSCVSCSSAIELNATNKCTCIGIIDRCYICCNTVINDKRRCEVRITTPTYRVRH